VSNTPTKSQAKAEQQRGHHAASSNKASIFRQSLYQHLLSHKPQSSSRMTSVSFILACLVCTAMTAPSASIQHPNLRGPNILDLIDLDLDDLPCSMRDDPILNSQCVQQGENCETQGKHCYVINVSSGPHYICSSNEPCSDTNRSAANTATTTTTSTTTTTLACIDEGDHGCHPSPHVQPNCCPGSYCAADPSSVVDGYATSFKCFLGWSELGDGELDG